MRDEVLEHYGNQLKDLKGLELGGPFLVTKQAWCAFFENIGSQLEELTITDTFRIDSDVISSLVDNCPNLKELRLKQIVKLDDSCVRLLTGLTSLKVLELSDPGLDVTDAAIVDVLNSIGSGLQELNLAGCALLTVDTLLAIKACCRRLTSLTITEATSIHDADVESFFYEWKLNPGLRLLNFSRIGGINELAFDALLQHSANSLEVLNINSTKLPAAAWQLWGLNPITTPGRLRSLDVGFVRSVDDEVVERICDACGELVELKVWGDNRITQTVRLPEGVRIIGREADLHYQNLGAAADRVVIGD